MFVVSSRQEHLLEVRITASAPSPGPRIGRGPHEEETHSEVRQLSPEEKLVLVCLAQRYLRLDPQPQPLTWAQVAFELGELRPAGAVEPEAGRPHRRRRAQTTQQGGRRSRTPGGRGPPAGRKRAQPQPHHRPAGHHDDRQVRPAPAGGMTRRPAPFPGDAAPRDAGIRRGDEGMNGKNCCKLRAVHAGSGTPR